MSDIGKRLWDITPLFEGKAPRVRQKIVCPICGSNIIWFKQARAFERSSAQYRVDIITKCGECAYVMVFGVHISKDEFDRIPYKILEYGVIGNVNVNEVV